MISINAHHNASISPLYAVRAVSRNLDLLLRLTQREVVGRYRGSFLGILWSLFYPVLMLGVYTFVFSVVFRARWTPTSESKTEFALALFAGLMVFSIFSECVTRAPALITSNVNFVKKIVFPLEILPLVNVGSALFHFAINFCVWLLFYVLVNGAPHASWLLLPLVLIPVVLFALGISWFLASLGVFLRDVNQIIGVVTTVLMFLSPVFYPVDALPVEYRDFMRLSPLTYPIEDARSILFYGNGLSVHDWLWSLLTSGGVCWLGFAWFQKTRKGFADVL